MERDIFNTHATHITVTITDTEKASKRVTESTARCSVI